MINYDRILRENRRIGETTLAEIYGWQYDLNRIAIDAQHTALYAKYSDTLIDRIDATFESATKLNKLDISFLLLATALQCVRQYVIGTITQRVGDKEAASKTPFHNNEHSDRRHRLYNPSVEEITTNPVPFDAIYGSKDFGLNIGGGFHHRARTLGHDPLLGWVFGTANIATSTITNNAFNSYHVLTGLTAAGTTRDKISKNANTVKVLNSCKNKLLHEGVEGKTKIGVSVMKEAIHLRSDIYTKKSLPLPVVSAVSVDAAKSLADFGLDMGNVVKVGSQAGYAVLINALIGMIHGLFYDEIQYSSRDVYAVKTRKILSYSNMIASASNVIAVAIASIVGVATGNPGLVAKSVNYLDIGGIMVTIYRIITDRNFICAVKKEFLEQQWFDIVAG